MILAYGDALYHLSFAFLYFSFAENCCKYQSDSKTYEWADVCYGHVISADTVMKRIQLLNKLCSGCLCVILQIKKAHKKSVTRKNLKKGQRFGKM